MEEQTNPRDADDSIRRHIGDLERAVADEQRIFIDGLKERIALLQEVCDGQKRIIDLHEATIRQLREEISRLKTKPST